MENGRRKLQAKVSEEVCARKEYPRAEGERLQAGSVQRAVEEDQMTRIRQSNREKELNLSDKEQRKRLHDEQEHQEGERM